MQKKCIIGLILLLCLPLITLAQSTPPIDLPGDYSVEMEMNSGTMAMKTKLFVKDKGELTRSEVNMMGNSSIAIVRKDKGVMWMVLPSQKMYMEQPLTQAKAPSIPGAIPTGTWEKQGEEKVDGQDCEKWKCDMQANGQAVSVTYWVNKSTKIPAQVEAGGMITQWKNFKAATPDASLFEVPANFRKMAMPQMLGK